MKLIKVTDTKGKVWHLNTDWILKIASYGEQTDIEFAILVGSPDIAFPMGMRVKEPIEVIEQMCEGWRIGA